MWICPCTPFELVLTKYCSHCGIKQPVASRWWWPLFGAALTAWNLSFSIYNFTIGNQVLGCFMTLMACHSAESARLALYGRRLMKRAVRRLEQIHSGA